MYSLSWVLNAHCFHFFPLFFAMTAGGGFFVLAGVADAGYREQRYVHGIVSTYVCI